MAKNVETISHVEDGLVLRQRHPVADGQGVEVHGEQGHIPQLARQGGFYFRRGQVISGDVLVKRLILAHVESDSIPVGLRAASVGHQLMEQHVVERKVSDQGQTHGQNPQ